jgi:hypothetical protein
MNWLHSFRWRVLLGAFLWTLGLVPLAHLIFSTVHHQTQPSGRVVIVHVDPVTTLVFAFLCMLGGIWQVRAGLLPFGRLRRQLSGVRDGSGRRVEGAYPIEVQPLVNDLNSLLEHRERTVRRALAKAGDLAAWIENSAGCTGPGSRSGGSCRPARSGGHDQPTGGKNAQAD